MKLVLLLASACLLIGLNSGTSQSADTYLVGVTKIDITPDYPIRLNGFGNRRQESEGISQRIYARALAISSDGDLPFVLIAIDSLGVRLSLVDEVARRLHESHGVPRANVALTFTHSHCTPKVNGASDNIFSQPIPAAHEVHIDRYTSELTDRITTAARNAIESRRPSRLEWGIGKVGFAKNRRTAGGPVDHDLPVLVVRDAHTGQINAVYVSYACHCVTLSFNQINGDWAGYAASMIERRIPGTTALISIGAGSDSNPNSGVTGGKVEIAERQGVEIATEVERLLKAGLKSVSGPPKATLNRIDLPLNGPPNREALQAIAAKGGSAGYNALTQLARLDRGESLLSAVDYPVQTLSFGDSLCIVFLAGEVCVDYSLRLKKDFVRDCFWLNAYCNDFCSYIPSERLVREGGYGGGAEIPYFALPSTLKPGLEQLIVDEVHRQVPQSFATPSGTQGVAPKSPQDSLRCMQTHGDLRIELAAAEPLVSDPVAIDFGTDGSLWVAEMNDYGHGVYEKFEQHGRIRRLRDTDGDGQFDDAQTFLDGLRFPTDVKVWRDGVLICDAPDILFARDTDNDGVADATMKLFSGFEVRNAQARVNSLRFGLDNQLYGSCGLFGGTITSHLNGEGVEIGARDFRFDPDTGHIEAATGRTQQGRCRNDWGDWFGCTNGTLITHYPTDDRYSKRNPFVAAPPSAAGISGPAEIHALYPPDGLVRFELSGSPGRATSACGLGIYRDDFLGEQYFGNAFTCEPVHQLVHRIVLQRIGLQYSGRRSENEQDTEFLTSTDKWFRPVQVRTGTDGAVWVVDMYRYVIEHSRWIPQSTLAELDVYAGRGRGRIYRIVSASSQKPASSLRNLDVLSNDELVAQLGDSNGPVRDLAQQMLIWRKAVDTAPKLRRLAGSAERPQGTIHALSTLAALDGLTATDVSNALGSDKPEVIRHAVRLSEPFLRNLKSDSDRQILEMINGLIGHADIGVRRQIAWSLGEVSGSQAAAPLAKLAASRRLDGYLRSAVLSSVTPQNAAAVLRIYQSLPDAQKSGGVLRELVSLAIRMGNGASLESVLDVVTPAMGESVSLGDRSGFDESLFVAALDAADAKGLASNFSDTIRMRCRNVLIAASRVVSDIDEPAERYQAAMRILGRAGGVTTDRLIQDADGNTTTFHQRSLSAMASLVSAKRSAELQADAVAALSRTGRPEVADLLLQQHAEVSTATRNLIVDALISRDEWAKALLNAVESGGIRTTGFDATRRQRLVTHQNANLRMIAARVFKSGTNSSRSEIVKKYESAASIPGDVDRGRAVFRKRCVTCHRMENHGFVVGPDLHALTNRDPKFLVTTILDPNREVDARYVAWTAIRDDGRSSTGLIVEETASSIRLREPGGKEHIILRSEIEVFRSTEMSVMPEGLERDMSVQDVADVIAYVTKFETPPKKFAGNTPQLVSANDRGEIRLAATTAEIRGGTILFEDPFRNIGYWHGVNDRVTWKVDVPKRGRFDLYLDASCANESAGNRFRIDGRFESVTGIVAATGGWDRYRSVKVGTVLLEAGRQVVTVRPDGPLGKRALFDLREVRLVPEGQSTEFRNAAPANTGQLPRNAAAIAQFLLDESQSVERRQSVIDQRPGMGPAIISMLTADFKPGDSEVEYRRIPWIWRVALAVGKRNDGGEIRDLLDVSLPQPDQPLRDWQAVVIGGGIVNGLSINGQWPTERIDEVLAGAPEIGKRRPRTLELAAAMADDEKVRSGTRYDALRMIALSGWKERGPHLLRYLQAGVTDELQMGAVSGLADIRSTEIIEPLIKALPRLSPRNRKLALEALLRTDERSSALQSAVESRRIKLRAADVKPLLEHTLKPIRVRALRLKMPK